MSIRPASQADAPAVIAVWTACDLVVPANDPFADFYLAVHNPCSAVLVNEAATGQIDATVMVGHDGHRGWLYYVATAPHARATGLGRSMVQAAEQWLRERGVAKAQLLIRETNPGVVAFYERLGFEVAPRIVMGKALR